MHRFLLAGLAFLAGCNVQSAVNLPTSSSTGSSETTAGDAGSVRPKRSSAASAQDAAAAARAGNAFALDVYAKLRDRQGKDFFFSPYSVHAALTMTSAGAHGSTADEMAHVLHWPEARGKHADVEALARSLEEGALRAGYQLSVANRLWGQEGYGFLGDFLSVTREHYGAELAQVDFANNTEQARSTINSWIAEKTRGKIGNLVPPGMVDALTRLVLTNAIYFKGQWKSKFSEQLTGNAAFHVSADESLDVPLMFQTAHFRHHAADGVQLVELPYGDEGLSMVVVLPDQVDGLAALEAKLSAERLDRWLSRLASRRVMLHLPRFKMTSEFNLGGVLQSLGMKELFTPGQADLSGMNGNRELFVSAVIHKAFVEVNEEGTVAAAATAVVTRAPGPVEETKVFRADHPFLFLIRDDRSGSILFLGRVVKPQA